MKNWLKNLLFVLFSFVFMVVGMVVAEFFIRKNGNPLKDPNFLSDASSDTMVIAKNIVPDSTEGWDIDSVNIITKPLSETKKESFVEEKKSQTDDYQVIIGIFGERSNANREVKRLKAMGYNDAFSFSKLSMNVVCVGLFSEMEAKKISSKLKSKGFDAIVKHQ